MGRQKKQGKRATGIQARSGYLYIITTTPVIKDGKKKYEKSWISTGLKDTPENVKVASAMRLKVIDKKRVSLVDRNISVSDYVDTIIEKRSAKLPILLTRAIFIEQGK